MRRDSRQDFVEGWVSMLNNVRPVLPEGGAQKFNMRILKKLVKGHPVIRMTG